MSEEESINLAEDAAFMVFNYSRLLSDHNQSGNYGDVVFTSADFLRSLKLFAKLLEHKLQLVEEFINNLDNSLQALCHESLVRNTGTVPQTSYTPGYLDKELKCSRLESTPGKSVSADNCQISIDRLLLLFCQDCETCRILAFQICK